MSNDVAILGVGMHPWGKWGRNFVEYGVAAARAALADAGVDWMDVGFVAAGETVRNGYPGYVAASSISQALGWNGARIASCYAACASGAQAIDVARARFRHELLGLRSQLERHKTLRGRHFQYGGGSRSEPHCHVERHLLGSHARRRRGH